jgi:(1->4)-alpha-D-glucan 1-alpha-D-glucosylmutase
MPAIIPRATYRLQLNKTFTLRDATALVPYFAALGISHIYCSPYFRARPGSMHGYDVVDHNSLNPEIGTSEDLDAFVAALRAHGMGHILDIVPNHVGVMGADNAWWMDVLENGPASQYAQVFDIDWQPANPALVGKLLVPVLGDPYGRVLERGELELRHEAGSFAVFYHEHRLPLDPRTYPAILERTRSGNDELGRLITGFRGLPDRDTATGPQLADRHRDKEELKQRLAALLQGDAQLAEAVQAAIRSLAGTAGDPKSFDAFHELLDAQAFRLAYWRVASDDINYRRFFDVNDLAALRMENEAVFEATHRLTFELVRAGKVDGLRIDHPDGLNDPAQYFRRLQSAAQIEASPTRTGTTPLALYVVVEKITASFEGLPRDWPVHGTTGYNFANTVNGLLVDSRAKGRMDRIYRNFIIDYVEWADSAYDSRILILRTALAAELNVLANQLTRIALADRRTRDFTLSNLRRAITEVIACFPVYRTYVADGASDEDRRYVDWALAAARRRSASTDPALFEFLRAVLLADASAVPEAPPDAVRAFAMKFQQVTSPVTAKGVEDTALYRFNRLVSLNEVGGEPEHFGLSVRAFHADCRHRAERWPHEMLATSTHDTKRSEDVRARIDVLSEVPGLWRASLQRWSRMNRGRRRIVDDLPAPGPHAEYLLYQTLLGTWPLEAMDDDALAAYRERIEQYMIKATREGKRRTSWANPNAAYEDALLQFVRLSLDRREGNPFPDEVATTARKLAGFGFVNSLTQTLLKLTTPGVPDIYQGNELWDFSLVDPDNRRPVDYARRQRMLRELASADPSGMLDGVEDGRAKLYLTWKTLQFRRDHEVLFRDGTYLPLRTSGEHAAHLCAFMRKHAEEMAIVVVPRLSARLMGEREGWPLGEIWGDTVIDLPERGVLPAVLCSQFTREDLSIDARALSASAALARFPVALISDSRAPAE